VVLEQGVAGVAGQGAEHVGPEHRRDHGPVAAARLAGDAAVLAGGEGRVGAVHERHHLVAQVVEVAPGARGVEELAAPQRGPAVDEHDDRRRRCVLPREQLVDQLGHGGPEGAAVPPHVDLAGVALDHVDGRVAAARVVADPGGQVHP
jgi:hypothetical protein